MKVLVVAPHPDDEILGCGGTLLRRLSEGATLGWLIATSISEEKGWSSEQIKTRDHEIQQVREMLGIASDNLFNLGFPTTLLDTIPLGTLIQKMSEVFRRFQPDEVLVPFHGDVHSDHRIVSEAVSACTKWFRFPSVKRVLAYETPSETDFSLNRSQVFIPNVFVDISLWMDRKMEILQVYQSEIGEFPFPRSDEAIRALAQLRGSRAGVKSAEGFQLLFERE